MLYLVNLWQGLDVWPVQDSQRQADHLEILAAGGGGNVPGLCAHVKDDAPLQPRDQKVRSLVDDILLDTGQPVEDDGSCSAPDVVDGLCDEECAGRGRDGHAVHEVEGSRKRRHFDYEFSASARNDPGILEKVRLLNSQRLRLSFLRIMKLRPAL